MAPQLLVEELEAAVNSRWHIDFCFNPPGAPHWGGSWERLVREIKKILANTCEDVHRLSSDAFRTVLVRVEGILNRRPMGLDEDGRPIRPWDILHPGAREGGGFQIGSTTLEMATRVQDAVRCFWQRWRRSYLHGLSQAHQLGHTTSLELRPGDAVVVADNTNPLVERWDVGEVMSTRESTDGLVRLVKIKINGKEVERDVRRVAVVEGAALDRARKLPAPTVASGGVLRPFSTSVENSSPCPVPGGAGECPEREGAVSAGGGAPRANAAP